MIEIFNENCLDTIKKLNNKSIDLVLTSPPYNSSRKVKTNREIETHKSKYEEYNDSMPNDEYRKFITNVINELDRVIVDNGVILLNLSYASSIEIDSRCSDLIRLMYEILDKTQFDIADIITWKKSNCLPNNRSSNKLSRICEYIFVLCRKDEYMTFNCNKKVTSYVKEKKLTYYENIYNCVEAKNNDGACSYNKATYSSELCEKLLNIYVKPGRVVYDPFIGTGTTAVACKRMGIDCIGSEISKKQVDFALERLSKTTKKTKALASEDYTYCINNKCKVKCDRHKSHYEFDPNGAYWWQQYCTDFLAKKNDKEV